MDPYQDVKYPNPPVVEVVCEFRFVPGEPWDATVLGLVYDRVKQDFPRRRSVKTIESESVAEATGLRQQVSLIDRMQFLRDDERAFVQASSDLLAVNHLEPYPAWEGFMPLIRQGFDAYVAVAHPKGLRRIGLRYINRIKMPDSRVDLPNYLNFRPLVGPGLPEEMTGFMVGIQSPYDSGRDTLRLLLSSAEAEGSGALAIVLDLDYFLARSEGVQLGDALRWLETAHTRVQTAFESCLTDQLKETFRP